MRSGSFWKVSTHQDSTELNLCLLSLYTKGHRCMNKADIPLLSVATLGELIQKREISPIEATEAYLERIDAIDNTLHSYITVCRHEALQAARAAEQELARGEYRG